MEEWVANCGWTNYETWCVASWIESEMSCDDCWSDEARKCVLEGENSDLASAGVCSKRVVTRRAFGERLRKAIEYRVQAEIRGASLYSDLVWKALGAVNWFEIADNLLDEIEGAEGNV